ncbi:MAG: helix-turn-helix transcriptional regulator [Solobacterium sp.]|jgi:AraC-like DNA-binding protein|nr:helix-turn-helix transcriptional regulator [Solobacterium sp.]MCH4048466.1 helix-turn-helix transcriptional regulator [Solobacterium sp.]MCH4074682.1 helix-turn-helix transcriptional regulator [Solobacterium sp.]MCI1408610.1 helix-turn-helix transcriptional regulator [Solobacterium sp.]MCI1436780.1 helix-turn-helix transcriptional regulator [Solobacterium sp.]
MEEEKIWHAVEKLGSEFESLNWNFRPDPSSGRKELISQWLGPADEDVMLCVFKGKHIHEQFHRQDFFFLNFAMQGDYRALSSRYEEETVIHEGDCYIGQPFSGYALRSDSQADIVIPGILIQKQVFFNEYLAPLSTDPVLLKFFLDPQINQYSDEYIHLKLSFTSPIWDLLHLMLVEYADKKEDTQKVLKPMIFSLMMFLTREYSRQNTDEKNLDAVDEMIRYIDGHLDGATLSALSSHFGYHPNYISSMLHKKTGRTFSEILLNLRMQRAALLMKNTDLSLEKISNMIGYHNTSNFYKAFRSYYGVSPRTWQQEADRK